jgi:ADP-ribose pyrophosphatase YjhB (NUDIX family)
VAVARVYRMSSAPGRREELRRALEEPSTRDSIRRGKIDDQVQEEERVSRGSHDHELDRFCGRCGAPTELAVPPHDHVERAICSRCGFIRYQGPRLLVLAVIFAENRMLMMRRGHAPYAGSWALPGGYVEFWETPEAATIREVREETALVLSMEHLIPFGTLSVPAMNQVHCLFIARLERCLPITPHPPESLEARWCLRSELKEQSLWQPAYEFDMDLIYSCGTSDRFDFYQRTADWMRVITDGTKIRQVWVRE